MTLHLRQFLIATTLLFALAACRPGESRGESGQVWLVSTRRAPWCIGAAEAKGLIDYWQLNPQHQWARSSRAEFLATDDAKTPTTVFLHGNQTDADGAICRAALVRQTLECEAAGRPFRFVIWSWPSDRVCRRIRCDSQLKAELSDVQGYYLAGLLGNINPQAPVSLVGYSFGARAITAALHLLAGGAVDGHVLPAAVVARRTDRSPRPLHAVLVAAAMDADWLLPGHCHGLALSQVDQALITRNCADRVMRFYSRLYGRGGPAALGYAGATDCGCLGPHGAKIELVDVSCAVGKVHDWTRYISAPGVQCRLGRYAFLDAADKPEP